MMRNLPHPIQYQGSKRNLAPIILKFFSKKAKRIVEPFAGTAAISIVAAAKQISREFWINDINSSLSTLKKLQIFIQKIWNEQHSDSVEHYYQVRERFNRTQWSVN